MLENKSMFENKSQIPSHDLSIKKPVESKYSSSSRKNPVESQYTSSSSKKRHTFTIIASIREQLIAL